MNKSNKIRTFLLLETQKETQKSLAHKTLINSVSCKERTRIFESIEITFHNPIESFTPRRTEIGSGSLVIKHVDSIEQGSSFSQIRKNIFSSKKVSVSTPSSNITTYSSNSSVQKTKENEVQSTAFLRALAKSLINRNKRKMMKKGNTQRSINSSTVLSRIHAKQEMEQIKTARTYLLERQKTTKRVSSFYVA